MRFEASPEFARELDRGDELSHLRTSFHIPKDKDGKELYYLCGNSLGLAPKNARAYVSDEISSWEKLGVEGHFHGKNPWVPYHEFVAENLAAIVGCAVNEVVAMNTLTVNHHLMMVSFYRPTKDRYKILLGWNSFPSNRYAALSQIRYHGLDPKEALVELKPRVGGDTVYEEDIEELLEREGEGIALVSLEQLNYYSGQALDVRRIIRAAHKKGCMVGLDLAHSAGNLELKLHDDGPDFAAWCSYKYLNGGPGCIAGCFVHARHASADLPRFSGWWGNKKDTRFKMGPEFEAIPGAEGWQLSNPPIWPLAGLRASLELFSEAGMSRLRQRSIKLTGYLEFLLQEKLKERVEIITPREPQRRGCQLSLRITSGARQLSQKLIENKVVCDFREPDVLRVAPVPLYNSFQDVFMFVEVLRRIV